MREVITASRRRQEAQNPREKLLPLLRREDRPKASTHPMAMKLRQSLFRRLTERE